MPYFFRKFAKILQNLASAAVLIGALRVYLIFNSKTSKLQQIGLGFYYSLVKVVTSFMSKDQVKLMIEGQLKLHN